MSLAKPNFPAQEFKDIFIEINFQETLDLNKQIINDVRDMLSKILFHHPATYQHSLNVARLSAWLSREIGLLQSDIQEIAIGALLHDIGKTNIDIYILDKPGVLTKKEWLKIKKHPQCGVEILERYSWSKNYLPMLLYHHERIDGQGYYGLSVDQIPLSAKIICICDAFDAMFTSRSYQERTSIDKCLEELIKNSNTQFASELINPFLAIAKRYLVPYPTGQ